MRPRFRASADRRSRKTVIYGVADAYGSVPGGQLVDAIGAMVGGGAIVAIGAGGAGAIVAGAPGTPLAPVAGAGATGAGVTGAIVAGVVTGGNGAAADDVPPQFCVCASACAPETETAKIVSIAMHKKIRLVMFGIYPVLPD